MKLYAISDVHVSHPDNLAALGRLNKYPEDWLLLGGDVGESTEDLKACLEILKKRFAEIIWVPGNHELWTTTQDPQAPRGERKYRQLVEICRDHGVHTPEDEFLHWPGEGTFTIAPLFLLYDYSFRGGAVPRHLNIHDAVEYSRQQGIVCVDEELLHPTPYASRQEWCQARVAYSEQRLDATQGPLILLNHFPIREEDAGLPMIPPFILWCGTTLTEQWPQRYAIHTAVHGHLHIRRDRRNAAGQRFVDVSLGYPRQRSAARSIDSFLVEILPA